MIVNYDSGVILTRIFLMRHSQPLFLSFCLFHTIESTQMFNINFADDWIRTLDLWYRKRPLCQLSHNHCPSTGNMLTSNTDAEASAKMGHFDFEGQEKIKFYFVERLRSTLSLSLSLSSSVDLSLENYSSKEEEDKMQFLVQSAFMALQMSMG